MQAGPLPLSAKADGKPPALSPTSNRLCTKIIKVDLMSRHVPSVLRWTQRHTNRRKRNRQGDLRPVLVSLPRELYNLITADADERGETVEQWIIAEAEAAFDEDE